MNEHQDATASLMTSPMKSASKESFEDVNPSGNGDYDYDCCYGGELTELGDAMQT